MLFGSGREICMITREETINMLDELNKKLYKMTDEELYDYMMENSQSFRDAVREIEDKAEEIS